MGNGGIRILARPSIAVPTGLTVALAVILAVDRSGGPVVRLVSTVIIVLVGAFATGGAVSAARANGGRVRTAWAVMAAALAAWVLGDIVGLVREFVLRAPRFPSPADVFYLLFTVLAVSAVMTMAHHGVGTSRHSRLRTALDGVTIALCSFLLAWMFALRDVYEAHRSDPSAMVPTMVYPIADIVALAVSVAVLARSGIRQRPVLSVLVLAFGLALIADTAFAHAAATGAATSGNFIDIGYAVSLVAFGVAAQLSRSDPLSRHWSVMMPTNASLWMPYLPLLLAGTVGPLVVMTGFERVVVPFIVIAVCLRQSVAAWENRRLLSRAANQALRDPLTGLANQTLFRDRLARALMLRSRDDRCVAVVSLDLDDFKLVNDSLGHPAADSLLVEAGRRILDCVRAGDTVARFGGDEFALLLDLEVDDSNLIAQRVVDAFNEPFVVDGHEILMRPSIGVAVAPSDEPDIGPQTLINRADLAMLTAKRSRSSRVHTYDADMATGAHGTAELTGDADQSNRAVGAAKVQLLGELRHAIDKADLTMAYQPKVSLATGRIVGVEALLRWPHPRLGLLSPDSFMSLVRQHGLMRPVTNVVLDKVLADAVTWIGSGVRVPVAVNLFAPFFRETQLPDNLDRALARRGLPADILTVEITEDLVLNDLGAVTEVLRELRERGMRVAIDDFGTGFSALSYLRDLPIDEIKLDRFFIAPVHRDHRAAAVVRAVIDLAHELQITVVAEGVEEEATATWLRDKGCDIGQGYFFGRPMEASGVPALVQKSTTLTEPMGRS
ncbi:bifunctional diguanylate cyclase/phosphodiesterase [Mycobacterium sp. 236(2023)]|uniref:putative bifunctional diguanylate cyclase/phosphodiesterase n=1 Tax=Mycobacterium sp. 236(2023) TaxID=3038163 RepID=UPI0024153410|nr:bifunctional diguanylate cyclase/phosphodiesterase [Mycobacterium sp. 236(2023)]MDG4666043.1 bifunctional diguanylate cyclase/phosphodiesterase [Mycobacterium sp. 236(2023)]